jgi:hypothetical protein
MKKLILMGLVGFTTLMGADAYFYYSCDNKKLTIHHHRTVFDFAKFNGRKFFGKGVDANMMIFESSNGTRLRFVDNTLTHMIGDVHTTFTCHSIGGFK